MINLILRYDRVSPHLHIFKVSLPHHLSFNVSECLSDSLIGTLGHPRLDFALSLPHSLPVDIAFIPDISHAYLLPILFLGNVYLSLFLSIICLSSVCLSLYLVIDIK